MLLAFPALLLGAGLALWLQPVPHSDWGYYWNAAGSFSKYERGGVGLWLLAIPKTLGLSPVVSALCLNLPAAAIALWISWRADDGGVRGLWLACAAYLVLIAPYFGIVQLDLVAATSLGVGAWLAATSDTYARPNASLLPAVVLVAVGVSTKPQFALTLWAMAALLVLPWLSWRARAGRGMSRLLLILFAGSILGFAADYGLRSLGDRDESIRTSSAVTLYGGLLVSGLGQGCGYWSGEAAQAARADLHKPLVRAALDRLSAQPPSHWDAVIRCKLPEILRPPPFATYWLIETPSIRARIDADPRRDTINAYYYRILAYERELYHWLTLGMLLTVAVVAVVMAYRRRFLAAVLPVAWIASFWGVHLIFEIQGRYFLGMYLLAPLFCMLALSVPARSSGDGSARPEPSRFAQTPG